MIIVIVTEREEKRSENEGRERRKRERRKDKRRERGPPCSGSARLRVYVENTPVCTSKTHVEYMRAFCSYTRSVLNVHMEAFGTYTRRVFRVQSRATHRHHRHHTHTHIAHTRMLGYVHDGQPTVILHSVKIWNICNVRNFMRTFCFWN